MGVPLTTQARQRVHRRLVGCSRDTCLASPCLSWGQNLTAWSLNGSLLVHTCTGSLAALVSAGDTSARAHVHTACDHRHTHLDASLQHVWPPLQALGVAPNNHIQVSVGGHEPPRAELDMALGQCTLTAHGDVSTEANTTHANWTLSLVNRCPLLEVSPLPTLAVQGLTGLPPPSTLVISSCLLSSALSMKIFRLFAVIT